LDAIAGCAREIATRLEQDSAGDIDELTGRLRHFVSQIRRTLHDVIVDTTASSAGLSTNDDVDSFSEQMQRVIEHLRAFDGSQESLKAEERRQVVRELKQLFGQLKAQADEIRNSSAVRQSFGDWRRFTPTLTNLGAGAAAAWTGLAAFSSVSFEDIQNNYNVARDVVAQFAGWTGKSTEDGTNDA
jgi:ABC-type transporter Mla subunit MlaD